MALRAGSVGLGREAGLGARRGWTRRRRPLPRPGRPPFLSARARPPLSPRGPAVPRVAVVVPLRPSVRPPCPSRVGGCGGGREGRRARGPRGGGSNPARAGAGGTRGPPVGGGPGHSGGPAAAATLDASRALPVDRPSCGGRRGRTRGARRVAGARARAPSPPSRGRVSGSRPSRSAVPPPGPPPGPRFSARRLASAGA